MNIITNNCLGGFIYRDILKEEYKNPFIWTSINHLDLIDLIENFDTINFVNIMIDRDGKELGNNFITIIDDKYKIYNHHVWFSAKDNEPRIEGNNVFYNKPWEYIVEKYEKRLKRMPKKIDVIAMYWHEAPKEYIKLLIQTCKKHNIRCLIITDKIDNDEYAKIIPFYTTKEKWEIELENKHSDEILDFLMCGNK